MVSALNLRNLIIVKILFFFVTQRYTEVHRVSQSEEDGSLISLCASLSYFCFSGFHGMSVRQPHPQTEEVLDIPWVQQLVSPVPAPLNKFCSTHGLPSFFQSLVVTLCPRCVLDRPARSDGWSRRSRTAPCRLLARRVVPRP